MTVTLDALARPSGTFLMVAMDQRESLRTMLREHGHDATDERLRRFKLAVARELGPTRPSLYKCQVPFGGKGVPEAITAHCREIDAVLPCPWVVLSQGVEPADFPAAAEGRSSCP